MVALLLRNVLRTLQMWISELHGLVVQEHDIARFKTNTDTLVTGLRTFEGYSQSIDTTFGTINDKIAEYERKLRAALPSTSKNAPADAPTLNGLLEIKTYIRDTILPNASRHVSMKAFRAFRFMHKFNMAIDKITTDTQHDHKKGEMSDWVLNDWLSLMQRLKDMSIPLPKDDLISNDVDCVDLVNNYIMGGETGVMSFMLRNTLHALREWKDDFVKKAFPISDEDVSRSKTNMNLLKQELQTEFEKGTFVLPFSELFKLLEMEFDVVQEAMLTHKQRTLVAADISVDKSGKSAGKRKMTDVNESNKKSNKHANS